MDDEGSCCSACFVVGGVHIAWDGSNSNVLSYSQRDADLVVVVKWYGVSESEERCPSRGSYFKSLQLRSVMCFLDFFPCIVNAKLHEFRGCCL